MEYVLGTAVARKAVQWESKLVLLSGAASCPAKRESRCLDNKVLEVSLSERMRAETYHHKRGRRQTQRPTIAAKSRSD